MVVGPVWLFPLRLKRQSPNRSQERSGSPKCKNYPQELRNRPLILTVTLKTSLQHLPCVKVASLWLVRIFKERNFRSFRWDPAQSWRQAYCCQTRPELGLMSTPPLTSKSPSSDVAQSTSLSRYKGAGDEPCLLNCWDNQMRKKTYQETWRTSGT